MVIAAVDGAAAGGGVGLVAAADLALATARATFGLPEVTLGLLPAMVFPVLLERLTPQRARMLALSPAVSAEEALALGLVDRVVADAGALQPALRGAIKHALRCNPRRVAELKALGARMAGLPLDEALALGRGRTAEHLGDPEQAQHLRDFLAQGAMPWFARYRPEGGQR